jgi:hypothetical protein
MADDVFDPVNGLKDTVVFPTDPADEPAARKQFQDMLDQMLGFFNTHKADLATDADGVHGLKIESGTFTPTLKGGTTAGSNTYATQSGNYYKIGNLCFFSIHVALSAKDAAMAGIIYFGGLPFNFAFISAISISRAVNTAFPAGFTQLAIKSLASNPNLFLEAIGSSQATAAISAANISNNSEFIISGCYIVA